MVDDEQSAADEQRTPAEQTGDDGGRRDGAGHLRPRPTGGRPSRRGGRAAHGRSATRAAACCPRRRVRRRRGRRRRRPQAFGGSAADKVGGADHRPVRLLPGAQRRPGARRPAREVGRQGRRTRGHAADRRPRRVVRPPADQGDGRLPLRGGLGRGRRALGRRGAVRAARPGRREAGGEVRHLPRLSAAIYQQLRCRSDAEPCSRTQTCAMLGVAASPRAWSRTASLLRQARRTSCAVWAYALADDAGTGSLARNDIDHHARSSVMRALATARVPVHPAVRCGRHPIVTVVQPAPEDAERRCARRASWFRATGRGHHSPRAVERPPRRDTLEPAPHRLRSRPSFPSGGRG